MVIIVYRPKINSPKISTMRKWSIFCDDIKCKLLVLFKWCVLMCLSMCQKRRFLESIKLQLFVRHSSCQILNAKCEKLIFELPYVKFWMPWSMSSEQHRVFINWDYKCWMRNQSTIQIQSSYLNMRLIIHIKIEKREYLHHQLDNLLSNFDIMCSKQYITSWYSQKSLSTEFTFLVRLVKSFLIVVCTYP